jgi:N-acetylglucosaminyl-diphospho-decaprenol L-rhamnosyltransferase
VAHRWAAVVVAYDAGDHLVACVDALVAPGPDAPDEVVVVDNASRDGSPDRIEGRHPAVQLVRAGANLGYARAANLGIAAATAPIVAVINCDAVLEPPGAAAVLARFDDPGVGAVGPRIVDVTGTHYPSARSMPHAWVAALHGLVHPFRPDNRWTRAYRQTDLDPAVARPVDWVSGAAVWLRRRALDDVGGWDERYFMYVEDVDLCWRLRRAGHRVWYEPATTVVHVGGASTRRHPYRMLVEHHRSLYRFADVRWTGARRALLAPTAAYLVVRAAMVMARHALAARRSRRPRAQERPQERAQ